MNKRLPTRGPRKAGTDRPARKAPGKTILLVDEDAGARASMRKALSAGRHRFLEAGDGEEALSASLAHDGPIHLLVTDVMTPVMNGMELAERLCAMRPEIRVLFVSGYAGDALSGNACADREWWLPKPFTSARLSSMVRRILGDGKRRS